MVIQDRLGRKLVLAEVLIEEVVQQDLHPMVLRDRLSQLQTLFEMTQSDLQQTIEEIAVHERPTAVVA